MKKLLRIGVMLGIAIGGLALQPARGTPNALYASDTSSTDCLFYKYFVAGAGLVTCYDEHGFDCAVCAT